jgi:hypothetical protein
MPVANLVELLGNPLRLDRTLTDRERTEHFERGLDQRATGEATAETDRTLVCLDLDERYEVLLGLCAARPPCRRRLAR